MKKVMIVLPSYPLGGAERQAFLLAKESVIREDVEISVLDLKSDKFSRKVDEVEIFGLNTDIIHGNKKNKIARKVSRIINLFRILVKIKKLDRDVFIFYSPIFLPLFPILRIMGVRSAFSVRENFEKIYRFPGNIFLKFPDYLYTNTPSVKRALNKRNIKCDLFLNSLFLPEPNLANESVCRSNRTILVISNLEPHKKIEVLLEATKDLDLKIEICGKMSNTNYLEKCRALADSSSCNVRFRGAVSESQLNDLLDKCTMLVHTSIIEGTSNAIIDALSRLTPVLVADTEENSYLVDDLDCMLFDANNVESLRNSIIRALRLLNADEYLRSQLYLKDRINFKFNGANLKPLIDKISAL